MSVIKKFLKIIVFYSWAVSLFPLKVEAQEKQGKIGFSTGIGLFSQVARAFVSEENVQGVTHLSNPKLKNKAIIGTGYYTSASYLFDTGYRMHIGYDIARLKQYYNDPVGFFWENSYSINYHVYHLSFSRDLRINRFTLSPGIGIVIRRYEEDYLLLDYSVIDDANILLEFPVVMNRDLLDIGLKVAFESYYSVTNTISLGIRISSDVINFIPETFSVYPCMTIKIPSKQ